MTIGRMLYANHYPLCMATSMLIYSSRRSQTQYRYVACALPKGESQTIKVVYFPFPTFAPTSDKHMYTCQEEGRQYLYEGLARNRAKELFVDEDEVVVDYPSLFLAGTRLSRHSPANGSSV